MAIEIRAEAEKKKLALVDSAKPATGPALSAGVAYAAARQSIIDSSGDIVAMVIAKAEEGSYLHAKFLFEFAGLGAVEGAPAEAEEKDDESLMELLLRRLEE